jgi:hypothetical protein
MHLNLRMNHTMIHSPIFNTTAPAASAVKLTGFHSLSHIGGKIGAQFSVQFVCELPLELSVLFIAFCLQLRNCWKWPDGVSPRLGRRLRVNLNSDVGIDIEHRMYQPEGLRTVLLIALAL